MRTPCSVYGCDRPVNSGGLCSMHYLRVKRHGSLDLPPRARPTVEERLLAFHSVDADTGCWRWQKQVAPTGYGIINIDRRPVGVHRVAYEIWVGPIPEGMQVDHVRARGCVNRDCMNPAHLEAVTPRENARRALVRDETCKRGHAYTPDNLRIDALGRKRCKTCHRMKTQESRARRRIEALDTYEEAGHGIE